ncbi:MAG: family 10 glycosylhydrolase [Armatimonadota bacterium]|nr:MAG: family 10 glycosylhydrolase [Armatimonadota bacterium]
MSDARKQAAHRTRRIIMNNDGNDAWRHQPGEPKTPEHFLSKRTSPLVGSHVDAIFYCTGVFNVYTHHSDETELRAHADRGVDDWAHELIKQGRDSLRVITDFGHEHGMEVFWSMRMNDTHDSGDAALFAEWKTAHPDYLMGKKGDKFPYGGGRWSAVDYAIPEVRDKVFRILHDVCTRYDVDGMELDFFRHPVYFKPQMTGDPVTQEHCDMMTELIARLRAMADEVGTKRGRPLLIAVRVPDSVGYAKAIGLDLIRWLDDGLIDIIVGSGYFHLEPWENLVALGKRCDVPVYA